MTSLASMFRRRRMRKSGPMYERQRNPEHERSVAETRERMLGFVDECVRDCEDAKRQARRRRRKGR